MFDESWAIDQKATFMTALLLQAQRLIGLALIVVLAWAASENRGLRPSWRWIKDPLAPAFDGMFSGPCWRSCRFTGGPFSFSAQADCRSD